MEKYFLDIGEEAEIIAKEINGPSWNPIKKKIDINAIQTNFENEQNNLPKETIKTLMGEFGGTIEELYIHIKQNHI